MGARFKCGMYGGSFNPLHLGHVNDMLAAANQCERLIVVLCTNRGEADPRIRYRWIYDTIKNYPNVSIFILDENHEDKHQVTKQEWLDGAEKVKQFAGEPIDVIFYGDDYDDTNSMWRECYPNAKSVIFPRNEINSTDIRSNPLKYWDWMPQYVRWRFAKRVLVLGPESTGKTVMVKSLAKQFNTNYIEEAGRDLSQLSGTCLQMLPEDYSLILSTQLTNYLTERQKANKVFFEDTNALYTKYFLMYMEGKDKYDPNVQLATAMASLGSWRHHYDLVLVLHPTVAFVQDGCRVDSHEASRSKCLDFLLDKCHWYWPANRIVEIKSQDYNERFQEAVAAVVRILND